MGKQSVDENNPLRANDCFSIELTSNKSAELYMYAINEQEQLIQLEPNTCKANRLLSNRLIANKRIAVPQNQRQQAAMAMEKSQAGHVRGKLALTIGRG